MLLSLPSSSASLCWHASLLRALGGAMLQSVRSWFGELTWSNSQVVHGQTRVAESYVVVLMIMRMCTFSLHVLQYVGHRSAQPVRPPDLLVSHVKAMAQEFLTRALDLHSRMCVSSALQCFQSCIIHESQIPVRTASARGADRPRGDRRPARRRTGRSGASYILATRRASAAKPQPARGARRVHARPHGHVHRTRLQPAQQPRARCSQQRPPRHSLTAMGRS